MTIISAEGFVQRALTGLSKMSERESRLNLQFLESALDAVEEMPSPEKEETLVALLVLDAGHVVQRYPRVRLSGHAHDRHHM